MRPQKPAQQRDKLVGDLHLRKNPDGLTEATALLQAHLKAHRMKQTPERQFVLEKVYQLNGPVDIETLHGLLEMDRNVVSLQTVYNSLALLVDIHLVNRVHLIEGGMAFYERALHQVPHGYAVCRKCGKVTLLKRPKLVEDVQRDIPKTFRIEQITFSVFGLCRKCQLSERKAELREQKRREREDAAKPTSRAHG